MKLSIKQKEQFKNQIINSLANEKEIHKIIIFGSFVTSDSPNDIDIATKVNQSITKYLKKSAQQ